MHEMPPLRFPVPGGGSLIYQLLFIGMLIFNPTHLRFNAFIWGYACLPHHATFTGYVVPNIGAIATSLTSTFPYHPVLPAFARFLPNPEDKLILKYVLFLWIFLNFYFKNYTDLKWFYLLRIKINKNGIFMISSDWQMQQKMEEPG